MNPIKIFVGIEYGSGMEVLKVKTTEFKEVALSWLELWGSSKGDGVKRVRINYEQMYAKIIDEIPMFKVIETISEVPQKDQ
ncbi:hypothetical protein [Enterococcus sp. CWB-B31]|uniref:hypothetical protein n=1 Tax=Enterococcus sp. CWB-B31 TaxID=2885159 RepID=UPI001E30E4CC|nr:hypothetical protein [Enterococcus sp. CWB-B31]MCB5953672.1 hypothetical protein [Enterococcus sp. CWB-B31]